MVLWQSDLRVSWRAQWISLLIHGLVSAVILLMPWPLSYTPLWMILLSLVVFDCVRSQRRINTCQGEIKLLMDGRLRWQGQDWTLLRPPWLLRAGWCCVYAQSLDVISIYGWRRIAWKKRNGVSCVGYCYSSRYQANTDGTA